MSKFEDFFGSCFPASSFECLKFLKPETEISSKKYFCKCQKQGSFAERFNN